MRVQRLLLVQGARRQHTVDHERLPLQPETKGFFFFGKPQTRHGRNRRGNRKAIENDHFTGKCTKLFNVVFLTDIFPWHSHVPRVAHALVPLSRGRQVLAQAKHATGKGVEVAADSFSVLAMRLVEHSDSAPRLTCVYFQKNAGLVYRPDTRALRSESHQRLRVPLWNWRGVR